MRLVLLALCCAPGFATSAAASDYAGAIGAFRRAHGLTAVKPDSKLSALALKQTQAMSASDSISHTARNDDGG
jgi:uncharacterized protein YkwD